MSFSFFMASCPKTPQEVLKAIKDNLMALDTKTVVGVKALEKALEEAEKNFVTLRCMICGDGEVELNMDQVLQLALEVCKEDVLALMIHKLPNLGWEARKDLVHCWSILLKQEVESRYCSVEYMENHFEFLVVCYDDKEIALNCGLMLGECIKFPTCKCTKVVVLKYGYGDSYALVIWPICKLHLHKTFVYFGILMR
ncbi:hypothetical protein SADUNF_Sadunf08G0174700 [Salix dunnii]|uniref:Uncharacterized protein n=1 Tax=Salix dunnii TaxID=1413687 RepID=A0A835MUM5_9ROSI|nr:hypothetical protein SADUNF_Sadunf08G0174700 [Salix dunnii]